MGDTTSGEAEADARDHGPARFEDWSNVPCGQVRFKFSPVRWQPTCTESSWLPVAKSDWICAGVSAELNTATSSINPLNVRPVAS